jgi:hypothetical protein
MFDLRFRMTRITLLYVFLLLATFGAHAQFNQHEMSKKDLYFGIAMGVNMGDFKIIQREKLAINDSIRYFRPKFGPGFNLGIITNYQFHKNFDLRFIPTLSFSDKVY